MWTTCEELVNHLPRTAWQKIRLFADVISSRLSMLSTPILRCKYSGGKNVTFGGSNSEVILKRKFENRSIDSALRVFNQGGQVRNGKGLYVTWFKPSEGRAQPVSQASAPDDQFPAVLWWHQKLSACTFMVACCLRVASNFCGKASRSHLT